MFIATARYNELLRKEKEVERLRSLKSFNEQLTRFGKTLVMLTMTKPFEKWNEQEKAALNSMLPYFKIWLKEQLPKEQESKEEINLLKGKTRINVTRERLTVLQKIEKEYDHRKEVASFDQQFSEFKENLAYIAMCRPYDKWNDQEKAALAGTLPAFQVWAKSKLPEKSLGEE